MGGKLYRGNMEGNVGNKGILGHNIGLCRDSIGVIRGEVM